MNNVKAFYEGRKRIIEGFKNEIFLIQCDKEDKFRYTAEKDLEQEMNKIRNKNGVIEYESC